MTIEYYKGAYDFTYENDHHGTLTAEDIAARKAEFIDYIEKARPLTKEIYKDMDDDQKRKYRVGAWGLTHGLWVSTTGDCADKWDQIRNRWQEIAASRSRQLRKAAGWTHSVDRHGNSRNDYLVAPNGRTTTPSGSSFSKFTVPSDEYNLGMWDGVLSPDVKFTL